jgi:GNAT superfamily N-acetyltransferase
MSTSISRKELLEKAFRERLKQVGLYHETHELRINPYTDGLYLVYNPLDHRKYDESTRMQLSIEKERGDIISFHIEPEKRRQGYGRRLVEQIEDFCREQGCTTMQVTPSGQGEFFWPKMGFNLHCWVGLKKRL